MRTEGAFVMEIEDVEGTLRGIHPLRAGMRALESFYREYQHAVAERGSGSRTALEANGRYRAAFEIFMAFLDSLTPCCDEDDAEIAVHAYVKYCCGWPDMPIGFDDWSHREIHATTAGMGD